MIDCDVIVWLGLLPQPVKAKKECRQNKWLNFSLSWGKAEEGREEGSWALVNHILPNQGQQFHRASHWQIEYVHLQRKSYPPCLLVILKILFNYYFGNYSGAEHVHSAQTFDIFVTHTYSLHLYLYLSKPMNWALVFPEKPTRTRKTLLSTARPVCFQGWFSTTT